MRAGLVLFELLLAMVIAALIAAIATPRLLSISDAAAVRDETLRLVAALDATRGASIRLGVVATLAVADTSYRVVAIIGSDTIIPWRQPGPWRNGVSLGGAGQPIAFGPDGLATGVANRTFTVARGATLRRVVMSRLGRLTY
jgi:Tfp pilus assembly protein FimT